MSGSPGQVKYLLQLAMEWKMKAASIRRKRDNGEASPWPGWKCRLLTRDEALLRAEELECCANDLISGLGTATTLT